MLQFFTMKKIILGCLIVALTGMLACTGSENNSEDNAATSESAKAPEPQYKNLTMEQFESLVGKGNKLVLVDFYADWCQPCKLLKPHIESIGKEMKDKLEVVAINVDNNSTLSDQLKIDGIPLLHIYKDNKLVWQGVGYMDKAQLEAEINKL